MLFFDIFIIPKLHVDFHKIHEKESEYTSEDI